MTLRLPRILRPPAILLTLLIATTFSPAGSSALFGFGSESRDLAWLWIPTEDFSGWERLAVLMEADQNIKLTVALTPPMMTPPMREATASLIAEGRLEIALRLQGDPILPLIQGLPEAPRRQDPLKRIAIAREEYRKFFGRLPEGFVPGAGLAAPGLLRAFKAMRLRWVAVGGESADPWPSRPPTTFVKARPLPSFTAPLDPSAIPDPERSLLVYVADESQGLLPAGSLLDFLDNIRGVKTSWNWSTVSEVVIAREPGPDASEVSDWSSWTGEDYEAWWEHPSLKAAWKLYAGAAKALKRYRNSGTANLKVLESATSDLYMTQSSRFYRLLSRFEGSEEAREAEEEFRTLLISVYHRIKRAPPEGLFASLVEEGVDDIPTRSPSRTKRLRITQGPAWLSFANPAFSPKSGALWRIDAVRVDWDETDIVFTYRMGEVEAPGETARPQGLLLHTYIDLNHVVGAGSTKLLAGHRLFIKARDAWEYALSVTGTEASLYRWAGRRIETARTQPEVDPDAGEIRVRFPREKLRGNPLRWGYITTSLTSPLEDGEEGAKVVGIIGPLNLQRSIEKPAKGMKRLGALRISR